MSPEEKIAIQQLVVEQLQADAERHPTLLLDTLLSGDGVSLVVSIIAQQEALARGRAAILGRLLALFQPVKHPEAPPTPASVADVFAAMAPAERNKILMAAMTAQERE